MSNHKKIAYSKANALFIFFLAASFYLYEYILQVSPAVMAQPIMQTFNVGAAGFGAISAFYFYAYAPMQLPAGLLFDRYGPRLLVTLALLLCASGTFFFALTNSVALASMGRFLIGIGSAFSFIGVLVLISRWFPARQFALFAGIAQMMSSLGAIFGEVPLASLLKAVGWRHSLFLLAILGYFLALLVWLFVRDCPSGKKYESKPISLHYEWKKFTTVTKLRQTWVIGLYATCIWTPIAVFGALWGVPYLEQAYHVSTIKASSAVTMLWLGVGIGSPALGWLSDYFYSRRLALAISACLGLVSSLLLLYLPGLSFTGIYWVLLIMGIGAGGQAVSFAVVKDNNSLRLLGTASGFNNLSVLLGAAFCQPLVGYILSCLWDGKILAGAPVYSTSSYQLALVLMPVCFFISLLTCLFLLKESYSHHE